jgi:predicted dehydrogenase
MRSGCTGTVGTEDVATLLLQTDRGAIGSAVMSQITLGRKNRLWISLDGDEASLSFDQEIPEGLWIGGRDANTVVLRGSERGSLDTARYSTLPLGHPQGYQGSFNAFVADAYRAIQGDPPDGLPTFEDGWRRRHHGRGAPVGALAVLGRGCLARAGASGRPGGEPRSGTRLAASPPAMPPGR